LKREIDAKTKLLDMKSQKIDYFIEELREHTFNEQNLIEEVSTLRSESRLTREAA
jgi:hypothetical protein